MSFTPLYFYHNLNRAPGLALDAVAPYAQGTGYLKGKTANFLHTCENQLQNTVRVVYPILRHPRSSTISGVLLSTKYLANLTGLEFVYKKTCYVLSRRAGQIASIENQLLLKLKKLSSYCTQLNTSYIHWQKIPELQELESLKQELLDNDTPEQLEEIAAAISCCDEAHALVTLHRSMSTDDLSPAEMQALAENANLDTILSAVEENTGELLGSYTPQLLGPGLNELLSLIPKSVNPFALVSSSLMTTLRKTLTAVIGSSALAVPSTNYFVSSTAQKTLLQLSAISGMSAIGLYYQDHPIMQQAEEGIKEILQMSLELTCAYAGMLFFKTDESFRGYFHKIIPATAASKATEYYLDYRQSYTITSFAIPLLISSLVYNQAFVQENYQRLKTFSIDILSGEAKKQLLHPAASLITEYITNNSANILSAIALENRINYISPSLMASAASYIPRPLNRIAPPARITRLLVERIYPLSEDLASLILSVINQFLAHATEEQALRALNLLADKSVILLESYLTILQQDDMQELLLEIQQKLDQLDPEVEELKNQFLREVFFKKTGENLPLGNNTLDLLKKSFGLDIQAGLFASFKDAPLAIRMLWNSYSYHKKVDQTLTLELLLQGFIISILADLKLKVTFDTTAPEQPAFSYPKMAGLGIKLVL